MKDAVSNEVGDLDRRGTFKVIPKEEFLDGANALTAQFVLAIKSNADGQVKYKARYIIGGHRDVLKQFTASIIRPPHTRTCDNVKL